MVFLSSKRIACSRLLHTTIQREINRQNGHLKQISHSNLVEQKCYVLYKGQSGLLSHVSRSHPVKQNGHFQHILHSYLLGQTSHFGYVGQNGLFSYNPLSDPMGQNGHLPHIANSKYWGYNGDLIQNPVFNLSIHGTSPCKKPVAAVNFYQVFVRSMGATSNARIGISTNAAVRLNREDCSTKHDAAFSGWKLLQEHSSWKDHKNRVEGAILYCIYNLPKNCSATYELGLMICTRSGRGARKIDPSSVFPVYVGSAEDVRARLQQYGRDGAHLEDGPQLFREAFSSGFSIVFRYARMESQKDAQITEAQLLATFDYAWNKVKNNDRRNIFDKVCNRAVETSFFSNLYRKLFPQKKVGIKIKKCKPIPEKKVSNEPNMNTMSSRTFGIKRFYPLPQPCPEIKSDGEYDICGILIGDGLTCTMQPVKGRNRCAEHKGMRVNSYITKLSVDEKSAPIYGFNAGEKLPRICGFIMKDGSPCSNSPFNRNKRCLEHKGKRIR